MARLRDRPTTDLLVLMVAGTICFSVLFTGITAGMIALFKPNTDIAKIVVLLGDVLNTLIGLLAGFLAGRSDTTYQQMKRDAVEQAQQKDRPDA